MFVNLLEASSPNLLEASPANLLEASSPFPWGDLGAEYGFVRMLYRPAFRLRNW